MRYRNALVSGLERPGLLSEVNLKDGDCAASVPSPNPKFQTEIPASTLSGRGC